MRSSLARRFRRRIPAPAVALTPHRHFSASAAQPTSGEHAHGSGNSGHQPINTSTKIDNTSTDRNIPANRNIPATPSPAIFHNPELEYLRIPADPTKSNKLSRILAKRVLQQQLPTICDAIGMNGITNAAHVFAKTNSKGARSVHRASLDLSEEERRRVAGYLLGRMREIEQKSDSQNDQNPILIVNEDLGIKGLEIGMELKKIVEPLTKEQINELHERIERIKELGEKPPPPQSLEDVKRILEAHVEGETSSGGGENSGKNTENSGGDARSSSNDESVSADKLKLFTRFQFQKKITSAVACIPAYHKHAEDTIGIRFEPLVITDYHSTHAGNFNSSTQSPLSFDFQSDQSVLLATKNKANFATCADQLLNKWKYFCRMQNPTREARPKILAIGNEAAAGAVKITALANEMMKSKGRHGQGELCVVCSLHDMVGRDGVLVRNVMQMEVFEA